MLSIRIGEILALLSISGILLSATNGLAADNFEYPELTVTPRSTERIEREMKTEEGAGKWLTHLPIQASALTTLTAAIIQAGGKDATKDPDGYGPIPGFIVGGGWLATTLALSSLYRPYGFAHEEVSGMPAKTPREQLLRERVAEERIEAAARLGRKLTFLSVLTEAGAAGYMLAKSKSSSLAMVVDGVALAMSVTPLVFRYRWGQVAHDQEEYKKRIYAPIASAALVAEPGTGRIAPAALLTLRF